MINLEKELVKSSNQKEKELTELEGIKDVKLLLDNKSAEESAVLRSFNLDQLQRSVEHNRGVQITMEKVKAEYGNAYHKDSLKELAIAYDLKLLPLEEYKGGIDSLLASKIVAFCKERGLAPDRVVHSNSFFVLGPYESFNLGHNTVKRRPIVAKDPLLFYKDPIEKEMFILVHKWGNDFSPFRMLKAMKAIDLNHWIAYKMLIYWCIVSTCAFIISGLVGNYVNISFNLIGSLAVSGILTFAAYYNRTNRVNGFFDFFTGDIWRQNIKRREVE